MNTYIKLFILFQVILLIGVGCGEKPQQPNLTPSFSSVIDELRDKIETDSAFRKALEEALMKRDTNNFWYQKKAEDLLNFFAEWLKALPSPSADSASYYEYTFGAFYSQNRVAIEPAKSLVRSKTFSEWLAKFVRSRGEFMESEQSIKNIASWMHKPEVRIADYIVPATGFSSFNNFFTRKLRENARPIDETFNNAILISPADCTIDPSVIDLEMDTKLTVKGQSLDLSKLLQYDSLAREFAGGKALSLYLGITDYHRFHSPVQGDVIKTNLLGGLYFGVNDFYYENHRGYCILQTSDYGKVALIPVGIATISSVTFTAPEGSHVAKGSELGFFAYGGSAILLLFQKGYFDHLNIHKESHVLMGQRIGQLTKP